MVSRHLGEHLRTNGIEKKFIEAFKFKNTRNLIKLVEKWPFLTFAAWVVKFWNKKVCKLDENLRNFSFY